MKSENFVKQRFPQAKVKKYKHGIEKPYYVCWGKMGLLISKGNSVYNAWANAKKNILYYESRVILLLTTEK